MRPRTSVRRTLAPVSSARLLPQQQIAAWVQFDGTGTAAIQGHEGVSSLTDNGTGDYTITWAVPFDTVNYAIGGGVQEGHIGFAPAFAASASSVRIGTSPGANGWPADRVATTIIAVGLATTPFPRGPIPITQRTRALNFQNIGWWLTVDTTTASPTIKDSYNVNSITDNGAGDLTINYTIALQTAEYVVTGSWREGGTTNVHAALALKNGTPSTTSACRIYQTDYFDGNQDSAWTTAIGIGG